MENEKGVKKKKRREKKAECGVQESTEVELYWVHKSVTIEEVVLKMVWNNAVKWGKLFHLHYSKNDSERTTHGKIHQKTLKLL